MFKLTGPEALNSTGPESHKNRIGKSVYGRTNHSRLGNILIDEIFEAMPYIGAGNIEWDHLIIRIQDLNDIYPREILHRAHLMTPLTHNNYSRSFSDDNMASYHIFRRNALNRVHKV